jgi:hypothetical protein
MSSDPREVGKSTQNIKIHKENGKNEGIELPTGISSMFGGGG